MSDHTPVLQVTDLVTGYQRHAVLNGVDFSVSRANITAVIGHNGSGKSTLLKVLFGLLPVWRGIIHFEGRRVTRLSPRRWLVQGVAFLSQGNRVFNDLTVRQNIEVGAAIISDGKARRDAVCAVLESFPEVGAISSRRGNTLSGGEKQMVALASAMVNKPRVLLLDEPTLGLSEKRVPHFFSRLQSLVRTDDLTVVIAENKVRDVIRLADYVLVLRRGSVTFFGQARKMDDEEELRSVYL